MLKKIKNKLKMLSQNDKIILKNVAGAFLIKGFALVVSLFTMPAYLKFFNDEIALGLWFTMLSMLNWILNFDLGIGNGLRNNLTKALTENKKEEAKRYISSAYFSIGIVCVFAILIALMSFDFINWNKVLNIQEVILTKSALLLSVKIVFIGIIAQLFFKLISSVLYAMQKSSVNNFLALITSLITLISVLLIPSKDNETNMIVMAIVHTIAVILPLLFATIVVFCTRKMKETRPSFRFVDKQHMKGVLSLGGVFFAIQVFYMIIMNTNEYLITLFCGNEYVVDFQIYHRLFSLVGTLFTLALTPIWSAVTRALTQKDYLWLKSLYKKMKVAAVLGVTSQFLIIPILQFIVDVWLGENAIKVNYWIAIPFALMGGVLIVNSMLSSLANGTGRLKPQIISFVIGAIVKAPLAYLLINVFDSWVGVLVSNVAVLIPYCIVQFVDINKFLRQTS